MQIDPYLPFLPDRIRAFPGLSGSRLPCEIRALGYPGSYTSVKDALRDLRMPMAVLDETVDGGIYNARLQALGRQYRSINLTGDI